MIPSLSVRSFTELLDKPAFEQIRILSEQKYPNKEPQSFKMPYYGKSLTLIRNFYRQHNDYSIIDPAIKNIELTTKPDSKVKHNVRVIKNFATNKIAQRKFTVKTSPKLTYSLDDVELRLNFDLAVEEKKDLKMLFFNFRNAEFHEELARRTLEISHYILIENGIIISSKNLELIDLFSGKIHQIGKPRRKTIELMKSNINIIKTLWPSV